jgi:hypothetical protein
MVVPQKNEKVKEPNEPLQNEKVEEPVEPRTKK